MWILTKNLFKNNLAQSYSQVVFLFQNVYDDKDSDRAFKSLQSADRSCFLVKVKDYKTTRIHGRYPLEMFHWRWRFGEAFETPSCFVFVPKCHILTFLFSKPSFNYSFSFSDIRKKNFK